MVELKMRVMALLDAIMGSQIPNLLLLLNLYNKKSNIYILIIYIYLIYKLIYNYIYKY